jgi:hypothetical protein
MKIICEKCEIHLEDKFLSPRIIKEALKEKFNITILDERSNYLKIRLIRLARLYGAPFIWPQASVEVWIRNEEDRLIYEFFWPEYLAIGIPFAILIIIEERLREHIFPLAIALIFSGLFVYLDTRWAARRVRKAFESI